MTDRSQLTSRTHHLPEIRLDTQGGPTLLQRPGRALLALCMHDFSCAACNSHMEKVVGAADEVEAWGCDVALIMRAQPQSSPPLPPAIRVFYDPAGRFEAAARIDCPAVVIADEWADITFRHAAGPDHEFPAMPRVLSEIRYLAVRCPECEGEAL
jgi:hypothetical protein